MKFENCCNCRRQIPNERGWCDECMASSNALLQRVRDRKGPPYNADEVVAQISPHFEACSEEEATEHPIDGKRALVRNRYPDGV